MGEGFVITANGPSIYAGVGFMARQSNTCNQFNRE